MRFPTPARVFGRLKAVIDDVREERALRTLRGLIHVGASAGQERDRYARLGLDVLWIEPIPAIFAELKKNIAAYPRQRALCGLVLDRDDERRTFNIASNAGQSSSVFDLAMVQDIWPDITYVDRLELTGWTLDTMLAREGIDPARYDGMVIDAQGAELLVLRGSRQLMPRLKYIKAEVADFEAYAGCARPDDLADFLAPFGFREGWRVLSAVHPNGGRYYDITYTKRDA